MNQHMPIPVGNDHPTAEGRTQEKARLAEVNLIERLRAKDERACERLVRDNAGQMLAVARRFLRSEEDRADAVQEAFLSAFRAIDTFAGHSSLSTWLHRITINACLMRLRRQSRDRSVSIDALLPTFDDTGHHGRPVRDWSEQAPALLVREETRAQIRACIESLPEPYRIVLLLRDIEELDTEATAEQLGTTPGAIKTRLHRARQALRTLLEPLFNGNGPIASAGGATRIATAADEVRRAASGTLPVAEVGVQS